MSKYLQQFETFDTFLKNIPINLNISYLEDSDTFIFGLIGSDNLIIYENETKLNNMTSPYGDNGIWSSTLKGNDYLDSYSIGILSLEDNYNIQFNANIYKLYFNDPYILTYNRSILGDYQHNIGEIELGNKVTIQNLSNNYILHKSSPYDTDIYNCIIDENNPDIDSRDNCNAIIYTSTNTLSTGFINTTIPNSVVSIGNNAFAYTNKLYIITIPSSVTSIGTQSFNYCKDLHYVIIESTTPPTVTNTSFGNCANYMKIFVPDNNVDTYKNDSNWSTYSSRIYSINDIGKFIYYYGSSKLPETTSSKNSGIHTGAFPTITNHSYDSNSQCGCIEFESSVETIGGYGFWSCSSICTKIILPPTISNVSTNYSLGANNSSLEFIFTNRYYNYNLINQLNDGNTRYQSSIRIIPDILNVSYNSNNAAIPEIVLIPHRVKAITSFKIANREDLFKIKYIKIPKGIKYIRSYFGTWSTPYNGGGGSNQITEYIWCSAIKNKNGIYYLDDYVIAVYNSNVSQIIIWEGIHTIANEFILKCAENSYLEISSTVKNICDNIFGFYQILITGSGAYIKYIYTINNISNIVVNSNNTTYDSRNNCNAIIETATNKLIAGCRNSTIPNTITSIGNNAFSHCTGITNIIIPNSVTSIGEYAFYMCSGLASVTIGNSVTTIGQNAFNGCSGLTSVTIEATIPPTLMSNAFGNNASGRKIYVPAANVDTYKTTNGWSSYASYIEAIPT